MANILFIMLAIILLPSCGAAGWQSGDDTNMLEENVNMTERLQNLSEEQENLLRKISINKKRIQGGGLYAWQEEVLRQYDYAMDYLSRKYPSHSFSITGCEQKSKLNSFSTFWFTADSRDECWELRMDVAENGAYSAEDNFYSSFLTPDYEAALLETVQQQIPQCFLAVCVMQTVQGEEVNEKVQASSLLDGTLRITNYTTLYVNGSEVAAEELAASVQQIVRERGVYGAYTVLVVDRVPNEGVTTLDLEKTDPVYCLDFNTFDIQEG